MTPAVQDGVGGRNFDATEVTWECHVFLLGAWSTKLKSILTMAAHNEEFASRGEKYQTSSDFISNSPRVAKSVTLSFVLFPNKYFFNLHLLTLLLPFLSD